jgi:acetolactate synthase I/II/III large subunit
MDNAGFGTIARLEKNHYGGNFGCTFECDGKPYMADYAAMAVSAGARGVMIKSADQLGPTVLQAFMEDAPTPTPGHWQIHDIFRKGE